MYRTLKLEADLLEVTRPGEGLLLCTDLICHVLGQNFCCDTQLN